MLYNLHPTRRIGSYSALGFPVELSRQAIPLKSKCLNLFSPDVVETNKLMTLNFRDHLKKFVESFLVDRLCKLDWIRI